MEQNCGSCKSDRSKKVNGQKCEAGRCRRQEAAGDRREAKECSDFTRRAVGLTL